MPNNGASTCFNKKSAHHAKAIGFMRHEHLPHINAIFLTKRGFTNICVLRSHLEGNCHDRMPKEVILTYCRCKIQDRSFRCSLRCGLAAQAACLTVDAKQHRNTRSISNRVHAADVEQVNRYSPDPNLQNTLEVFSLPGTFLINYLSLWHMVKESFINYHLWRGTCHLLGETSECGREYLANVIVD